MFFAKIGGIYGFGGSIVTFLSPNDLIRLDNVSKGCLSGPNQWRKLGYQDKKEFKQIVNGFIVLSDNKFLSKSFLLNGLVHGFDAKEILKQEDRNKRDWCSSALGMQSIALRVFSPSDIIRMYDKDFPGLQWCLKKESLDLIVKGILTPKDIGDMDFSIRQRVLTDTGAKMLISGHLKKEILLKMNFTEAYQLDKMLNEYKHSFPNKGGDQLLQNPKRQRH